MRVRKFVGTTLVLGGVVLGNPATGYAQTPGVEKLLPSSSACGPATAPVPGSESPEALVQMLYQIISGPAGSVKNWSLLRALHAPGAIITPTRHLPDGVVAAAPADLEAFIRLNVALFANRGFYEREISRRVDVFGHVAHVLSTYESRETPETPPYSRGVNSFQLLNDGKRWCVLSVTWDSETPTHSIPGAYLPGTQSH